MFWWAAGSATRRLRVAVEQLVHELGERGPLGVVARITDEQAAARAVVEQIRGERSERSGVVAHEHDHGTIGRAGSGKLRTGRSVGAGDNDDAPCKLSCKLSGELPCVFSGSAFSGSVFSGLRSCSSLCGPGHERRRYAVMLTPAATRPIIMARAFRGVADGFVSVLLAQYLDHLGFSGLQIGAIVTGTLLGSAALTLLTGLRWGHLDPRRVLLGACVLMAATGFGFATISRFWPLLVIAVIGTLNPSAGDVSLFLPVEQAAIADRTDEPSRPKRFAIYNLAGGFGAAIGALSSPLPSMLAARNGWNITTTERLSFVIYLLAAIAAAVAYRGMAAARHDAPPKRVPLRESRRIVLRLAALFSLDSAGGGLATNVFLVLYLTKRFGLDAAAIGLTLSAAGLLASLSQLASARVAQRIGLVRTMVFTHIPANVFLVLAGIAPTAGLAVTFLLIRASMSSMDIPARQALVMRLVTPPERAAAAGVTNVPRSLATAATPALAGWMLDQSRFGWPLIAAGVTKIAYDILLLTQPLDRD